MSTVSGVRHALGSRRSRLYAWLAEATDARLPARCERDGQLIFVNIYYGTGRIEAFVDRLPTRLKTGLRSLSLAAMATAIITLLVGFVALGGYGLYALATFKAEYGTVGDPATIDLPQVLWGVVMALPAFVVAFVITALLMAAIYLLIFLFLLPMAVVHEFGHAIAISETGVGLESYGIVLVGPLPMGAFVSPASVYDLRQLSLRDQLWIPASGPCNDHLHAIGVFAVAWTLGLAGHLFVWLYVVLLVAGGLGNSIPAGRLDGGLFVAALRDWYWGFDLDGFMETNS